VYQEDCFDPRSATSDDELQQNITMGKVVKKVEDFLLRMQYSGYD
jgi:hypothetical protein